MSAKFKKKQPKHSQPMACSFMWKIQRLKKANTADPDMSHLKLDVQGNSAFARLEIQTT